MKHMNILTRSIQLYLNILKSTRSIASCCPLLAQSHDRRCSTCHQYVVGRIQLLPHIYVLGSAGLWLHLLGLGSTQSGDRSQSGHRIRMLISK